MGAHLQVSWRDEAPVGTTIKNQTTFRSYTRQLQTTLKVPNISFVFALKTPQCMDGKTLAFPTCKDTQN